MGHQVGRAWGIHAFGVLLAVTLLGCGRDDPAGPAPVTIETVEVLPEAATLTAFGASQQFQAVVRDARGNSLASVRVTWTSSNEAVATIDGEGLAIAVGRGTTEIQAAAGSHTASSNLAVEQIVSSVEVSPSSATLTAFGTQRFHATASDSAGHDVADATFEWSSTDPTVAAVDGNGLTTAQQAGTAWIVASTGGQHDSASVSVEPQATVATSPLDWRMPTGERVRIRALIGGASTESVRWSVQGIQGGHASVGTVGADGTYTAPVAIPGTNPVMVRVELADDPSVFAESAITVTSAGEQARILHTLWTPRVVDRGSADSLTYEVTFAGYPRFEIERAGKPPLGAIPSRSGTYGFRFSADEILEGYRPGDLHHFLGFLNCDVCARVQRGNLFVNVNDATVPPAAVTQLVDDMQVASHVVNLRYDDLFLSATIPTAAIRRFYEFHPDDFDFIAVVEQVASFNNRTYRGVRNDIGGLGLPIFDHSASYGGAGRLQGLIDYPIATFFDAAERAAVHEIGHRWIAFLDNSILASGVPHWPVSSLARGIMGASGSGGQGINFPYEVQGLSGDVYELVCGSGVADEYNDLELYLMGLLPQDSVGTHVVFRDQSQPSCGAQRTADILTIQDVIAVNGTRAPGPDTAQRDFRLATLVLSRGRLLTAGEMAFFNHMAARGEATTELHFTSGFAEGMTKPFYLATGRRATLTTRVWP